LLPALGIEEGLLDISQFATQYIPQKLKQGMYYVTNQLITIKEYVTNFLIVNIEMF
jgi:hypothetical protein